MKLSEVIKAIEDGSDEKYESADFCIYKDNAEILFNFDNNPMIFINPSRNWQEVKPPRQWSEKELMLFKLLPDWVKWVGRNTFNEVIVYEIEPTPESIWKDKNYETIDEDIFTFITITLEESPVYIGDLKNV